MRRPNQPVPRLARSGTAVRRFAEVDPVGSRANLPYPSFTHLADIVPSPDKREGPVHRSGGCLARLIVVHFVQVLVERLGAHRTVVPDLYQCA